MVEVTKHGKERIKERLGLSKSVAERNAQKALEMGLSHSECKGNLKRYVDWLFFNHIGAACNYRIYHHYVYCFDGTKFVTVMNLPQDLHKLADKLQNEKKKNIKETGHN